MMWQGVSSLIDRMIEMRSYYEGESHKTNSLHNPWNRRGCMFYATYGERYENDRNFKKCP